jgi:hypothetical protein
MRFASQGRGEAWQKLDSIRRAAAWGASPGRIAGLALLVVALAVAVVAFASAPAPRSPRRAAARLPASSAPLPVSSASGVVRDPIDPRYLTDVPFGKTSFWIQPWRAYLDTWPAARLVDALGINFNVDGPSAPDLARLLHDSGFRLARVEIPWDSLSYADPGRFVEGARVRARLDALREYGLRPLIVLNANSGDPCPTKRVTLNLAAAAPAGARSVTLTAASAAQVAPGRTGFNAVEFRPARRREGRHGARAAPARTLTPAQRHALRVARRAARRAQAESGLTPFILQASPGILIARVGPGDVATLSRPLPRALAAGAHRGSTLLYAPFELPTLADGSANPVFQHTLNGWLGYVAAVSRLARGVFGAGGYDLEVWNELGFGSQFLNAGKYYASGRGEKISKQVVKALLRATVAYVRGPASGIPPSVGIADGFADQSPFPTPAYSPVGLTALSKHLYANARSFPSGYKAKPGNVPLDALGARDTVGPAGAPGDFTPRFIPHYQSLFPEYSLTATSTETVVRDIAPIATRIYGAPHGRFVTTPGGGPLQVWMTEYNLGAAGATPTGPDEATPEPSVRLTPADKAHFQAKVALRSLVADVSKGMTREYFFAAAHVGALSLIDERFVAEAQAHPNVYPGDAAGGETMSGLHNMLARFQGPGPEGAPRQLKLTSITQNGNHAQFAGDNTPAHPPLYDRDVLAVLPFQTSPTSFAIPIYVMTRNLLTLYQPGAPQTDITRFDLPNETFHITLTNLPPTTTPPTITAYDPLRNTTTPTQLTNWNHGTATIEIAATDYPRILTIDWSGR